MHPHWVVRFLRASWSAGFFEMITIRMLLTLPMWELSLKLHLASCGPKGQLYFWIQQLVSCIFWIHNSKRYYNDIVQTAAIWNKTPCNCKLPLNLAFVSSVMRRALELKFVISQLRYWSTFACCGYGKWWACIWFLFCCSLFPCL